MLDPDRRRGRRRARAGAPSVVGDEAERDRLVEPAARRARRGPRPRPARDGPAAALVSGTGAVLGDVLVAVDPRDLLDQVDLALQVAPPARRPERQRRRPAASSDSSPRAARIRDDLVAVDRDPQDARDLVEPERDRRPLGGGRRRRRSRRGGASRRPAPGSARRSGGWPTRCASGSSGRSNR